MRGASLSGEIFRQPPVLKAGRGRDACHPICEEPEPYVKNPNGIAFEQWGKGQRVFRLMALNFCLERLARHSRAISRDQDRSDQLCIEIGLQ